MCKLLHAAKLYFFKSSLFKQSSIKNLLLFLTICLPVLAFSQGHILGNFPGIDGGFENQPSSGTATFINPYTSAKTYYHTNDANAIATYKSSGGRSGPQYLSVTTTASGQGVFTPTVALAQNTSYVVQYFFRYTGTSLRSFIVAGSPNGGSNFGSSSAANNVSSISSWTKRTEVIVSANTTANTHGLIRFNSSGGSLSTAIDLDDVVVYAGTTADVTAPNAATSPVISNITSTSQNISWAAPAGGVDGGGYVVVRYASTPGGTDDPKQNGIYEDGSTVSGTISGQVIYIGTSATCVSSALATGSTYYYKIYAVDKAFNYSTELSTNLATTAVAQNYRASASAGATSGILSLTINKPTGTVSGDVMIAAICAKPSNAVITPPAGWTFVRETNQTLGNTTEQLIYWRAAGTSEPASYTWTFSSSLGTAGGISSFYNINTTNPINVESGTTTTTALTHASPNVTTTVPNAIVITAFNFASSATWTPPAGMTEAFDRSSDPVPTTNGVSVEMNFVLQPVAGATGVKTATASNDAAYGVTQIIALVPASNGQWTGAVSSNWSTGGNWSNGVVPTASTNVVIQANVTQPIISNSVTCKSLTINSGATLTTSWSGTLNITGNIINNGSMVNSGTTNFNGTTQQTFSGVTLFNDLTVNNTSGLLVSANIALTGDVNISAGTLNANNYNITLAGDWVNNGTFTAGTGRVTFTGAGTNMVTGTSVTAFNTITVDKGTDYNSIIDVQSVITIAPGGLTLTNGTFKLSSNSSITAFTSDISAAPYRIPATAGLWVNAGTVFTTSNVSSAGLLHISNGILNAGNSADQKILAANGADIIIDGGTVNVAGRLTYVTATDAISFTITSGTFNVGTVGNTTNVAPFSIIAPASSFIMSGGTIVISKGGGANSGYNNNASTSTVTGGTLQIGNASTTANDTIQIYSIPPIWNLTVNNINAPVAQLANALVVNNDVTISGGRIHANNFNLTVGRNWINNGTFVPTSATVIFNGTTVMSGTALTNTFNNLTVAASSTVTSSAGITGLVVNGALNTGSGALLDLGTATVLSGTLSSISNSGTITTSVPTTTSAVPLPSGKSWGGLIDYSNTNGGQTVPQGIYSDLTVRPGNSKTTSAGGNLVVNGTLTITTPFGAFDMGTYVLSGTLTGINNSGDLKTSVPTSTSILPIPAGKNWGGTIYYNAVAGAQTVVGGTYNILRFMNSSGTNSASGDLTVGNQFVTTAGGTLDLGSSHRIIDIGGTITNNGTVKTAVLTTPFAAGKIWNGIGTVEYNAAGGGQTLVSGTFNNLKLSSTSGTNTMNGNIIVGGVLTFSGSTITTGAYNIYLNSTGTISRLTTGHVIGSLKKYVAVGATGKTFETGDAANYTPVVLTFTGVTVAGDLTSSTLAGDHAGIASSVLMLSKTANRTWTLTNSGIVCTAYSPTFTFAAGDLDAGAAPANFIVGLYSSGWTYPTVGTKTTTTTQATGLTMFGDFQLGEVCLPVGTPTAITIAAGTEPTCQLINGTTTTSYATTATNNTGYNWSVSNAAAGSISAGGIMTWANGFSGSVNIQVTANGCSGSSSQVTRTVSINPTVGTPTPIFIAAGIEPTCQLINGTTTTTYATSATNATSYNGSLSNPSAGSINMSTGVITWANGFSGSVNIQVSANGCNGPSAQVIRTVNITPTVGTPTAITIAAGTEPTCQLTNGTTTTTYATTATNNTGYNWSLSNAAAGAISAAGVMTWANGFSGSVNIQVTANGCNGPSAQIIRTVTIASAVGTPTAITIAAGTEPTCQLTNGTTTTTYATTATNNTGYNWSLSNAAAGSISAGGVMTWANGFSGSVNIQVTASGCSGTSPQVIRTVTITAAVGTPTAITIAAGTQPACQLINGTTTTTYATTATNNTGYNWSVSNAAAGSISAGGVMTWANGFSGSFNIQVTASGCNGLSAQVIRTVTITPAVGTPTAITIAAGTEPTCQLINGTTTTTYATTATNNTGYNWSVSNAAAGSINAGGIITWANGFSGSVNIQVTANGCNGTSAQVIRTVTITTAVGTPTAITIAAGTEPTCQLINGTTTTTYATTATNNTGYNWSVSNAAAGSISAGGVMTWANGFSGTVNIQVTANGCNGLSSLVTRTVTITATVGMPTAITIAAGTEPTCQLTNGTTTTTYATTATNNTGYNWSVSNAAAGSISAGGVMTWANGFSGSVNIQVTANGCSGSSSQVTRMVSINPTVGTPTPIFIAAGTEPTCQLINGTTTTTYATSATNATSYNGSLSDPSAGSINMNTGVITWTNGFSGSVNIQVSANGCNGPSAQVIRTVNITPTVGTPTAIIIAAGTEPTCQPTNGTTTTTYATTATNNTGFNWSVSNAAAGVISAGGVMTWANGFSGSVNIQVSANGCNGPSAQVTRTINITAAVGTPTVIMIAAGTEPTCQLSNGTTTTTYATTATNNTGYNWSVSNAAAGSISAAGVMTWTNGFSGSVNIQVTANGCNSPSTQVIRTVPITPAVGTPTAITISAGTQPACQLTNGTTTTTYATTATNATGYNWSVSNAAAGSISAAGVMTWTNGFSGSVNIQVSANGCNGPSAQVIRTVTITPAVGTPTAITIAVGTQPTCQLTNGLTITTYAATATNATGYNWSVSNAAAGSISAAGVMTWTNGFSGSVNIQVSANGCNGPSAQVTRTVNITPTVGTPTAITIAAGTEPACQLINGTTTTTYATTATNTTGYSWSVSNPLAGYISAAGVMTWTNGFSGSVNIQVSANGCSGPSAQVTRTVTITSAVGTPTLITISAGAQPTCQLANGTTTTTYTTTAINNAGYNWSVSNPAAGSISAAGVMTWANGFSGSVNIQVSANGCNGPSAQVIRTVNITPAVGTPTAITIAIGTEPTCQLTNSITTTTYATTATNNTSYNWSVSNAAAGSISAAGVMTWANGFSGSVNIQVSAIGCDGPSAQVIRTVTVTSAPSGTISYEASPYCSGAGIATVTRTGTPGGAYSSTLGLTLNAATGDVNLGTSTAGTYTITYTVAAAGGCTVYTTTGSITVTTAPTGTIAYTGSPYCYSARTAAVTFTGTPGGTYSSTSGLNINATTGSVDLKNSTPGIYTVTYTIPASSGCAKFTTATVVNIHFSATWTGAISTDWNNDKNWSCGFGPDDGTEVVIPGGLSRYPIVNSGSGAAFNLEIKPGGSLTVVNATLTIAGSIINKGTFMANDGTIEMNGTTAQVIPAATFATNTVGALLVNNTVSVSLGGDLNIYDLLKISKGSLNTNGYLTLKSSEANTARVSEITSSSLTPIVGNVTVERYIQGRRKYRLITSSVTTSTSAVLTAAQENQSIWANWQNKGVNTLAGTGTFITGGTSADGFDTQPQNASLYTYNSATKRFVAYTSVSGKNTKYTPLKTGAGYYMFVYGDRMNSTSTSTPNNTVLKATGTLSTGTITYSTSTAVALSGVIGNYTLVGNPYAAVIDWKQVQLRSLSKTIWGWDANINSTGAFVTITSSAIGVLVSPLSNLIKVGQYIQPGQAFFVQTTGGGPQMVFKESIKIDDRLNIASGVFRGTGVSSIPLMAVNLLYSNGSTSILADGVVAAFDTSFSNGVTEEDGVKMANSTEGISITKEGNQLSIDAQRMPADHDTLFLNITKLTKPQYTLEIFANDMQTSNLLPYLEDNYLHTRLSLSLKDTSRILFDIDTSDTATYSAGRFRIVFLQAGSLPLTFLSVTAIKKNADIQVGWNVAAELSIKKYEVERSGNGSSFIKSGEVVAKGNNTNESYTWVDNNILAGTNYYRIRAVQVDGKYFYSKIVLVRAGAANQEIRVFPNPVVNHEINLQLVELDKGQYTLMLHNSNGQLVLSRIIDYKGGTSNENIPINGKLPGGTYYLQVINKRSKYSHIVVVQ